MKRTHDSSELYFNSAPYSPIPHRYQFHPYIFYRSSLAKWKYLGMVAKPSIVGRRPTELDVTPTAEIQFFYFLKYRYSFNWLFLWKKRNAEWTAHLLSGRVSYPIFTCQTDEFDATPILFLYTMLQCFLRCASFYHGTHVFNTLFPALYVSAWRAWNRWLVQMREL